MGENGAVTDRTSARDRRREPARAATRIVLTYAVVAGLWILTSDILSRAITVDPNLLMEVGIIKGVLFVVVTSALLFVQIRGDFEGLKRSGEQLRASEQRFKRVVDVSPIPMAVDDADGRIILLNQAFVKTLGYSAGDIPTIADWWTLAYPDATYRRRIMEAWDEEAERSARTSTTFVPVEARVRCKDGIQRTMLVSSAPLGAGSSEQVVALFDITERERAEEALVDSKARLEHVLKSVIVLIGKVVETRDPYTQGHEEGVARVGRLIAQEMGLPADDVDGVEVAGLVHDVGKLSVPAEILTRPGKLSPVEFNFIKDHPQRGYEILRDIDFHWPVADAVLQHHERMDGSGYPAGLAGDEISIGARILMAADVIDAMGAHRPYRAALGLEAAMAEITGNPEKYDAAVVGACVRLYEAGRIEV